MQQTLAHRKINSLPEELLYILFRSAEAMNYPRLMDFVLLPQSNDFVMAPHNMQYHGLLQGFRKLDLTLENGNLLFKTRFVHLVQTCLAEGNDLWLLQVLFQFVQGFINLKISLIQCPRMDAVTVIALLETR